MQLGDAQYVLDYLKVYYNEHYNNTHGEVKKINIEPIKSKIPLPPTTGGKLRMVPVDSRKNKMPMNFSDDNYESLREIEKQYWEKMRYHFNLAAKAFKRGDGKTAKLQSKEGAKYKYLYLAEKRRAIDRTLSSKNSRLNINESIDLHGLHENEVEEVLDRYMTMLRDRINTGEIAPNRGSRRGHCVTIITGKGNNSRYFNPVVKNEVRRYLRENRIPFNESESGGCFTISVI